MNRLDLRPAITAGHECRRSRVAYRIGRYLLGCWLPINLEGTNVPEVLILKCPGRLHVCNASGVEHRLGCGEAAGQLFQARARDLGADRAERPQPVSLERQSDDQLV